MSQSSTKSAAKLKKLVPLREARKDFTRSHICAAAKEVFFINGYSGPTMETIAQAAGIQRSTLYTHFRDKEEILAAIAGDYVSELRPVIASLPGPEPTPSEVENWVQDFARFAAEQRAPTELLVTASAMAHMPAPVQKFGVELLGMFASRLPAFEKALKADHGLDHAWAMATLRELGWALCFYTQQGDTPASRAKLTVAAILFSRFVNGEV